MRVATEVESRGLVEALKGRARSIFWECELGVHYTITSADEGVHYLSPNGVMYGMQAYAAYRRKLGENIWGTSRRHVDENDENVWSVTFRFYAKEEVWDA